LVAVKLVDHTVPSQPVSKYQESITYRFKAIY
jgi:hypothetical protein